MLKAFLFVAPAKKELVKIPPHVFFALSIFIASSDVLREGKNLLLWELLLQERIVSQRLGSPL